MGKAVGDTLPLAIGVAISPVPVIAVILMLLSPRAPGTGVGFLAGWVVGVAVVVVASSTVAVPVIGYVAAGDRVTRPLDDLRDWLTDNNATVMTVLLLVIGAVILGQGVAGL